MSRLHNLENVTWVDIKKLKPHPKNRNKHPKEQIDRLAKILMYQGFRKPIVVSNRSGFIVEGHGRVEAAKANKWTTVPVSYQDFEDETQEYAHLTADNAIALWAELDMAGINADTLELGPFDTDLLGLKNWESIAEDKYLNELANDTAYTAKIDTPIYTPKGEKPKINELFEVKKTQDLIEKIKKSKVTTKEKEFLLQAANRHLVFNYYLIAEYYSHANKEMQELMEDSALVIIDFKKAIENGYVELSKDLINIIEDQGEE